MVCLNINVALYYSEILHYCVTEAKILFHNK